MSIPVTRRVVIVGAGPSGARCAESLAARGIGVTLIGAEPGHPYNRVALSKWLADDMTEAALVTHDAARLSVLGVRYLPGTRVAVVDRAAQVVTTEAGEVIGYDALVLALGAQAVRLALPGADLPHVRLYRTIADVREMIATAGGGGEAVVIGGGLLGLEAAAGLALRGMRVTVLHGADRLMNRQLDGVAAAMLAARLAEQGIAVRLGAATQAIEPDGVRLTDGTKLPARIVVMAVGITPEVGLARAAGLAVERGIVVDDAMRTSDPDVFAVGECAQHRGTCCGLVAPALAQAEVAARAIAGEDAAYAPAPDGTALKVAGAPVWSGGDIAAEGADAVVFDDASAGEYRLLLVRDDRLVGAVLYGETSDAPFYLDLIVSGRTLGALRGVLAFGRLFAPMDEAA
jgi:nitrite reductase (NADH) large subunit